MSKNRKLESSLEGLFSKSREKVPNQGKNSEEYIPTHPGSADIKDKKEEEKRAIPSEANLPVQVGSVNTHPEKAATKKKSDEKGTVPPKPSPKSNPKKPAPAETISDKNPETIAQDRITLNSSDNNSGFNESPEAVLMTAEVSPSGEDEIADDNTDSTNPQIINFLAEILDEEEEEIQLLIFRMENVDYGIKIELVQTIIKPQAVFLVPGTEIYINGLINLRGDVVPVVNLRTRFNLPECEENNDTRYVVVEIGETRASLIVDSVQGVATIPLSKIEKPSNIVTDVDTLYLDGIAHLEEQLILIINLGETINS